MADEIAEDAAEAQYQELAMLTAQTGVVAGASEAAPTFNSLASAYAL